MHKPHNRVEWFIFWFDLYTLYLWENGCNVAIPARLFIFIFFSPLEGCCCCVAVFLLTNVSDVGVVSLLDRGSLKICNILALHIFGAPGSSTRAYEFSFDKANIWCYRLVIFPSPLLMYNISPDLVSVYSYTGLELWRHMPTPTLTCSMNILQHNLGQHDSPVPCSFVGRPMHICKVT